MKALVVAILASLTSGVTGQTWTSHNATSEWQCQTVRKQINTTIVAQTMDSVSLAGCTYHCANTAASGSDLKLVSLYFDAENDVCYCNSEVDVYVNNDADVDVDVVTHGAEDDVEDGAPRELRYCHLNMSLKIDRSANQTTRSTLWPYLQDCYSLDIFYKTRTGKGAKGVHVIHPDGRSPVQVMCMEYGGTVIQRRLGGTVNFNRSWSDYVNGFGDATGEYWLGLKYLHLLTKISTALGIELDPPNLIDSSNGWPYLHYYKFTVGNESSKYVFQHKGVFNAAIWAPLHIYDMFRGQNDLRFSTFDNDNDESEQNLAAETQSGWWIGSISQPNVNVPYEDNRNRGSSAARQLFGWPTCDDKGDWIVNKTIMTIYRNTWGMDGPGPFCDSCC